MNFDESIAEIESCGTTTELKKALKRISEDYGFASFSFIDIGAPHLDRPFNFGTLRDDFRDGYLSNGFVHLDPCIPVARRSNIPFAWGEVPVHQYNGVRKSGHQKTMEFTYDHGYQEGFVVPFHFADQIGRINSAVVSFYWSSRIDKFKFLISNKKNELHLIMVYWAQRAVDIVGEEFRDGARFTPKDVILGEHRPLTDRERDVLSWAARGKTAVDTAEILCLSEETVKTHIRNALDKLGASNKTHGVAKAIYLGLIDV